MRKSRVQIYRSRLHLFFTILIVIIPLLFLLFLSNLTQIAVSRLLSDVAVSLWRLLVAYVFAVAIAWLLAVTFYRGKRQVIALPFFDVLQSFPTFAALPMATFFWGPSNYTIIFFLVITVIWPIFFSILSSLKLIRRDWRDVVEICRLRGLDYFNNFIFPVTIPGLITGSIIGLGEGWEALVATEIIVQIKSGLGNFFQTFQTNLTVTAAGILAFLIIIFSINKLIWIPLLDWSHHKVEE